MTQQLNIKDIYRQISDAVVGRRDEIRSILTAMDAGKHILLEGPPGTSKSTLLRIIARAAGIPFYIVEGNVDLSPAKLVGHFNPAKVMADNYRPEYFDRGPLTCAMEAGGLLYIEEFNRMPADVANVLISPMEEGEMAIPRYGTVQAVRPFTVIAAQNPYDDVGTVRVSRAFMDRICLIRMDYQTEDEERAIVRLRTGPHKIGLNQIGPNKIGPNKIGPNQIGPNEIGPTNIESDQTESIAKSGTNFEARPANSAVVDLAVKLVRATREHADIKLGASIRAGIDLVDLFTSRQKLADQPEQNFLASALMAVSNKIWLNEMAPGTADEIITALWHELRGADGFSLAPAGDPAPRQGEDNPHTDDDPSDPVGSKKKTRVAG